MESKSFHPSQNILQQDLGKITGKSGFDRFGPDLGFHDFHEKDQHCFTDCNFRTSFPDFQIQISKPYL
jgi:hypothetical protein